MKSPTQKVGITADALQIDPPGRPPAAGDDKVAPPDAPQGSAVAAPHSDIGNWAAVYWREVPMWRHRRTGQTLYKRDEVRRLRDLK